MLDQNIVLPAETTLAQAVRLSHQATKQNSLLMVCMDAEDGLPCFVQTHKVPVSGATKDFMRVMAHAAIIEREKV